MSKPWAIVVNPTKFDDLDTVQVLVHDLCEVQGWERPRWYETTAEDPGTGQARTAIAEGAELVCPFGGDGTVRAVIAGVRGSNTRVGLLPGGTGNLLARNLGLPVDDLPAALTAAHASTGRAIDLGLISFDGADPEPFLVIAGMGLDAEAMAGADTRLKRRLGWIAYGISGLSALTKVGFRVHVQSEQQQVTNRRAASVVIGNCGELAAGLTLLPEAAVDDGRLDALVIAPRSATGWFAVILHILSRGRIGRATLSPISGARIEVRAGEPVVAQLDGDAVGEFTTMVASIEPGAIVVSGA